MTAEADATLDEGQFDKLFEATIVPALAPFEAERRDLVRWFWKVIAAGVVVSVAVGIGIALTVRAAEPPWYVLIIAFAAWGFGFRRVRAFEKRCKVQILTRLARSLGLTYAAEFAPPGLERLLELGLLPGYERASFDDLFTDRRQGCDFQLYEAHLEEERGSGKDRRWVTLFRGQVIRIVFPKKFLGITVVNRDRVRRWRKEGFERVGLGASAFEKHFEVYGTDQVEARFLVHPAFMERLIRLEEASSGKEVRCAFVDGDLLIAIEGADLFEVASVFSVVPDQTLTRKGVEELSQVMGIVDVVMSPPPRAYG